MDNYSKSFLTGVNKKDERAWEKLFKDFFVPLCNHSNKIIKDDHTARDIVQYTLEKMWTSDVKFDNIKSLAVYMYRAVHNNTLKYLRYKKVEDEGLEDYGKSYEELSKEDFSSVVMEEVLRKLRSLIEELPKDRREVVLMSLSGKKGKEIAEELGISINTVKQQKYRAYKYIREKVGSDLFALMILSF